MPAELHLPDLPELPLQLGPAAARTQRRKPWAQRLRELAGSSLPLLVMLVLALASWWLVRNAPEPWRFTAEAPPRKEPDYSLEQFVLERFEANGRLRARLSGQRLHHFPDTDRIEIEGLRMEAFSPDGRSTTAQAARALSNGDASEVQLTGQAQVRMLDGRGEPVVVESEFLHLFTVTERVQTHRPVTVRRGASEIRAAAMRYDHARGLLETTGPVRAVLPPRGAGAVATAATLATAATAKGAP
jgi:lipopolysaccharide export system protein LptC